MTVERSRYVIGMSYLRSTLYTRINAYGEANG